MIKIIFECNGCDAKTEGTGYLRQKFESLTGRSYGFGKYIWHTPEDIKPAGWTASDFVGATYCPSCTAELTAELNEAHP